MKRRHFNQLAAASAFAGVSPAWAQAAPFRAGKDYLVIDPRVPTEARSGVEVVEFFWYGCPHCNVFEPMLERWIKTQPADVQVRRVPVAFRTDFVVHQKLYYAIEALGKVDDLHPKAFAALHREKLRLNTADEIGNFASRHGVDRAEMLKVLESFGVNTKARQATQLAQAYRIDGVPSIGIDGRYLTSAAMAGGHERALQATEFLIEQARIARKSGG